MQHIANLAHLASPAEVAETMLPADARNLPVTLKIICCGEVMRLALKSVKAARELRPQGSAWRLVASVRYSIAAAVAAVTVTAVISIAVSKKTMRLPSSSCLLFLFFPKEGLPSEGFVN